MAGRYLACRCVIACRFRTDPFAIYSTPVLFGTLSEMFDYKRTIYVCRQTLLVAAELAAYKLYMPFACDWQTGVIDFAIRQLNFVVCPPALAAARAPQAPQSRTTFRVDRGRRLVAPGVHFSPSPCPDNHLKPGRAPCWAPGSTRATALVEDAPPTAVPLDFWEARGGARGPLPQRPPREASALAATAQ